MHWKPLAKRETDSAGITGGHLEPFEKLEFLDRPRVAAGHVADDRA